MNRIFLFLLLFLPTLAFAQLYGTGVGYTMGVPTHTPNIAQKGSEACISIEKKMLYLWNRDSLKWKPTAAITVTFGAPTLAPSTGETRTVVNMQTGLIYWWNGSAWKELIAYSVELASAYAAGILDLFATDIRAELADSTEAAYAYADSLHLADNDRDSTNEIQTLFFDSPTGDLSISGGNNVSLLGLLNGVIMAGDTSAMLTKYIERGDTAFAFAAYISLAGWGLLKSATHTLRVDTAAGKVATRYYVGTNPTTIGNRQISHSNGSNLIGDANFLFTTTGNFLLGTNTDVPTSILTARSTTKSSSPFPPHTTIQSNAITGVGGNFEWVTDGIGPGLRWYNGTRGAYAIESTIARMTATYSPFADGNGQLTQSVKYRWDDTNEIFYAGAGNIQIKSNSPGGTRYLLIGTGTSTTQAVNIWGTSAATGATVVGFQAVGASSAMALGSGSNASANGISIGNGAISAQLGIAIGDIVSAGGTSGSIAMGRRTVSLANGQFVVGSAGNNSTSYTDIYFGSGIQRGNTIGTTDGDGVSYTINGSGALGTNYAGGNLINAGGKGTGSGTSGDYIIATATPIASGSTLQSLTNRWWVKGGSGFLGNNSNPAQDLDVTDFLSRDTIFNTNPPTHATNDGLTVWKNTPQGYALGKATSSIGGIYSGSGTIPASTLAYSASTSEFRLGYWNTTLANILTRRNIVGYYHSPSTFTTGLVAQDSTNQRYSGAISNSTDVTLFSKNGATGKQTLLTITPTEVTTDNKAVFTSAIYSSGTTASSGTSYDITGNVNFVHISGSTIVTVNLPEIVSSPDISTTQCGVGASFELSIANPSSVVTIQRSGSADLILFDGGSTTGVSSTPTTAGVTFSRRFRAVAIDQWIIY